MFSRILGFLQAKVKGICQWFKCKDKLVDENIALRSQIAAYQSEVVDGKRPKPKITNPFRWLWVYLSQKLENWKSVLAVVQPSTVVSWHRRTFNFYWRKKSQGRPKTPKKIVDEIRRINKENPTMSPEKIHERLVTAWLDYCVSRQARNRAFCCYRFPLIGVDEATNTRSHTLWC